MIDLALYICPASPISPYTLNSGELCYSLLDGSGYGRFLKNQHYETIWFDEHYVFRGLDTSNLPGEVYAQFTGERYGAIWCKRWVNVGDVTERNPDIRYYDANGKFLRQAPGGVSYLHVGEHYPTLTFPETHQTVADVVQLAWTFDPQGKNIIELYWYANGLGLVGFSYYGSPALHTRYSGLTQVKPVFTPLPNFAEPVPPPVEKEPPPVNQPYIPPPTTGTRGVLSKLPGAFVNIRQQPYTDAADVGDLRKAEPVVLGTSPQAPGWVYVIRESDKVAGWVSLQNGAVEFTLDAPELPETVTFSKAEYDALLRDAENVVARLKGIMLPDTGGTF